MQLITANEINAQSMEESDYGLSFSSLSRNVFSNIYTINK